MGGPVKSLLFKVTLGHGLSPKIKYYIKWVTTSWTYSIEGLLEYIVLYVQVVTNVKCTLVCEMGNYFLDRRY